MIYQAGLISFLRTALIIVLVYFGIKLLIRYLSPLLLKWLIKKQQDKYRQSNNTYQDSNQRKREGEVHIKSSSQKKHHTDELGDYVDYEEVNDKDDEL